MERAPLHLLDVHHGLSLFSSSDTCNAWTHTRFWTKQWAILFSLEYVISNWFCGHKPWSPCSQMGCFFGVCPYAYCASAASTSESVWGIGSVSPEKLSSTLAVLLGVVSRGKPVLSSPGTPVVCCEGPWGIAPGGGGGTWLDASEYSVDCVKNVSLNHQCENSIFNIYLLKVTPQYAVWSCFSF